MRWAWIDNLGNSKMPKLHRRDGRIIGLFIPLGKRIMSIRWDGY